MDFEKEVMAKVESNQIVMRPKWYFVIGSLLSLVGLVGLTIGAVFLGNITFFLLRSHGPMGQWRLESMIASFPWWIPILAIGGMVLGIWLLKKYDFSYKKNFLLIVIGFVASIIIASWAIDRLGLNETWSRRRPMRRFYQRLEKQENFFPKSRGNRFYRQN